MITTKQRAYLRGLANPIDPILQVGTAGIVPNLVEQVKDALAAREIIKMSVLETSPISAKEAAHALADSARADVVQVIGNRFTLYKRNEKNPVIVLPKASKKKV